MGMLNPNGGDKHQPTRPQRVIPFGKYLLLDRIAVGGMAEVYKAKSFGVEGFERNLAIKRILPSVAEDPDFIEMFIDEAKIAGQLSHANVCPIYELGEINGSYYIAMEFVWGKDVLQIINRFRRHRKRMPPIMAAWLACKVCEALDYAHRKTDSSGQLLNIIHRDVSPQNILVSYEGEVKLIDFGIAKAASRTTRTHAGVLKGKFGYMSPEQVRGIEVDHRSDLFALGTCIHEMVTGERLFKGESEFATLERVRHAQVTAPSRLLENFPEELDGIIMKALTADRDKRWQSAADMVSALQRFLSAQQVPFGTAKLAGWMRNAFATEMGQEKARSDSFAQVGRPPSLVPPEPNTVKPSVLPPTQTPAHQLALEGEETLLAERSNHTGPILTGSIQTGSGEALAGALGEQATHIFFSAERDRDSSEQEAAEKLGSEPTVMRPARQSPPSVPPVTQASPAQADLDVAAMNNAGVDHQTAHPFKVLGEQRRLVTLQIERPSKLELLQAQLAARQGRRAMVILFVAAMFFLLLGAIGAYIVVKHHNVSLSSTIPAALSTRSVDGPGVDPASPDAFRA
jgi:serine/threonine protein kinase